VIRRQDCRGGTHDWANLVIHGLTLGLVDILVEHWALLRICLAGLGVASRERNLRVLVQV
jgi:hypothetical protein